MTGGTRAVLGDLVASAPRLVFFTSQGGVDKSSTAPSVVVDRLPVGHRPAAS
ncbi:MAG: hypothetical protein ACYCSX_11010 [Acidimicrobiales bacterium]